MQKTKRVLATAYVVHISTFSCVSYRATTRNSKQASILFSHAPSRTKGPTPRATCALRAQNAGGGGGCVVQRVLKRRVLCAR